MSACPRSVSGSKVGGLMRGSGPKSASIKCCLLVHPQTSSHTRAELKLLINTLWYFGQEAESVKTLFKVGWNIDCFGSIKQGKLIHSSWLAQNVAAGINTVASAVSHLPVIPVRIHGSSEEIDLPQTKEQSAAHGNRVQATRVCSACFASEFPEACYSSYILKSRNKIDLRSPETTLLHIKCSSTSWLSVGLGHHGMYGALSHGLRDAKPKRTRVSCPP